MKRLIIATAVLSILGCNKEKEGYSISGDLQNIEDGKMVYLSELDENTQPLKLDSVAVKDGKFMLDLPEVTTSNLNFLNVEGVRGNVLFVSENEPIKFQIYKDSLQASVVEGGKENKLLYTYLDHIKELNSKVMRIRKDLRTQATTRDSSAMANLQKEEEGLINSDLAYKKKVVKENPDNFVSILILSDMINMGAPANEAKELYGNLSEKIKQTSLAKALKENLDKRSKVGIGSKAPEFTAPNPQGEEIALKDVLGKVTLIDFWAAWCKPCRVENPNIVKVYEKYHDKGFNILGVSLDRAGQKEKWMQAIKDDNLTWEQVSNLQFWNDPVATLYNVRAIPAAFLLDENGIIVAKNLRGDALEAKVKELLEK
ncbi:peroxiredoxin [Gillisia sp. Hel_I_86]|uniref:TlpA disulfide reductase family protein n=1 Tax=Gillisia sp. Hel_I_86 TaxID=1249981 RepID=UPI00119BE624|nr:TlpA disulfide reductase family protein [Gillisia sp. Hel_I_86]TVZ28180.1 peroxiredoxin [Gillisia sp. Hel_I_86]